MRKDRIIKETEQQEKQNAQRQSNRKDRIHKKIQSEIRKVRLEK